jgi:hypothetical protein
VGFGQNQSNFNTPTPLLPVGIKYQFYFSEAEPVKAGRQEHTLLSFLKSVVKMENEANSG